MHLKSGREYNRAAFVCAGNVAGWISSIRRIWNIDGAGRDARSFDTLLIIECMLGYQRSTRIHGAPRLHALTMFKFKPIGDHPSILKGLNAP
jgi:hypothetical protein